MKKTGVFLVLALVLCGCATNRMEQVPSTVTEKCDAPVWEEGDTWQHGDAEGRYSEKRVRGKTTVDNEELYIIGNRFGTSNLGVSTKTLGIRMDLDKETGAKLRPITTWEWEYEFPLYVGKKWSRTVTGKGGFGGSALQTYIYAYKVTAYENVTVQAGTFKAFKIEREQRALTIGGSVTLFTWYSPQVKNYVKQTYAGANGIWIINFVNTELTSYSVKTPGEEPPAAMEPPKPTSSMPKTRDR